MAGIGLGSPTGASGSGRVGNKVPSGYRAGQLQQFTPEQMQLFQQLFSHVGPESYLSKLAGGDQQMFNEIEAPALRQFNDVSAGIANRFSGMGTGGRHSSGFQNAQTAAGSNFAQQLQAQRQSLQQQAIKDLMGLSGNLLQQRPYEQFLVQKQQKQGGAGGLIGGALGGIGGFLAGGPAGALTGAQLGYGVGSGSGFSSGMPSWQSTPNWDLNNALPIIGSPI